MFSISDSLLRFTMSTMNKFPTTPSIKSGFIHTLYSNVDYQHYYNTTFLACQH